MLSKRIQDTIAEIKQQLADAANSHPGLAVLGTVQHGISRIEADLKDLLGIHESVPGEPGPAPQGAGQQDEADDKDDEHEDEEPGLSPQVQAPRRPGRI